MLKNPKKLTYTAIVTAIILAVCGWFVIVRQDRSPRRSELVERDFLAMNTVARISLAGSASDADVAARTVQLLESHVSAFIKSSDIARVNEEAGSFVKVEPMTYRVVAEAVRWSRETDGAFDPTVGPIVKLWRDAGKSSKLPDDADVLAAKNLVDYRKIDLSRENEIALMGAGMTLDLGGIAKGYAADLAAAQLRALDVEHALIDLGGNVVTIGARPDGAPWNIGLQKPGAPRGEAIGVIEAAGESIVTSGPYERFIEIDGVKYHHIFDPRTGRPVSTNLASVTVVSQKSVDGDALATAFSVMGVDKARAFLASHKTFDAIFIVRDGERFKIFITPGLEKKFRTRESGVPVEILR